MGKGREPGQERTWDIFGLVLGKPSMQFSPRQMPKVQLSSFLQCFCHASRWDSSGAFHLGLFLLSSDPPSATDHSVEFSQGFYTSPWAWAICTWPNTTYVTVLRVQTLLDLGSGKVLWYLVVADTSGNVAEAQTFYFKRCGMRYNKSFSFHFTNPH